MRQKDVESTSMPCGKETNGPMLHCVPSNLHFKYLTLKISILRNYITTMKRQHLLEESSQNYTLNGSHSSKPYPVSCSTHKKKIMFPKNYVVLQLPSPCVPHFIPQGMNYKDSLVHSRFRKADSSM